MRNLKKWIFRSIPDSVKEFSPLYWFFVGSILSGFGLLIVNIGGTIALLGLVAMQESDGLPFEVVDSTIAFLAKGLLIGFAIELIGLMAWLLASTLVSRSD